MKKEEQNELLLRFLKQVQQSNAPEPRNFDDARFFIIQRTIVWIYHDDYAPVEDTVCRFEISIKGFIDILVKFLGNDDIQGVFDAMEENKQTSFLAVTETHPLHQKFEKIYRETAGFIADSRSKNTLCKLIVAICRNL